MEISVGHTPDADDAFMFYGMFTGKVSSPDFTVTHVIEDIENLNRKAVSPELDVTAVSVHACAYIPNYTILRSGGSFGIGYGPIVTATEDEKNLKTLFDYTIDRHYPKIKDSKTPAIDLLKIVMEKQTKLVVDWMRVGFIHGVMNTDNMAISGETIDYGPCAFMDAYDPETVFSSIDHNGRYAYFNQPGITKWNLARFAETLLPLIDKNKDKAIKIVTEIINNFGEIYKKNWLEMMRKKLGLIGEKNNDEKLINNLHSLLHEQKADYTNTFCSFMNEEVQNDKIFNNKEFIDWHHKWK